MRDTIEIVQILQTLPHRRFKLDLAKRARVDVPVVAYNVSAEYSMVKAAAQAGWIDGDRLMLEVLTSIKRAGADLLITYHALEAAQLLG